MAKIRFLSYKEGLLFINNIGVGVCRRNRYGLMGSCGEDDSNEALASGCFRKSLNA